MRTVTNLVVNTLCFQGGHVGYVENVVYSLMQISKCYRSPKDVRLCYEDDYLSGGVHKFVIGKWTIAETDGAVLSFDERW